MNNKNKVVLVTGSSSGIGLGIAIEFAQNGYDIAVHYNNNKDSGEKLAVELHKKYGVSTFPISFDISNNTAVIEGICQIEKNLGKIDVLVNNAGISQQKLFTDITEDDWDNLFSVNVKGAYLVTKAVLPSMINKKSGKIINISSIWGMVGGACEVHYSASKSAIIGFTKALAKEVAPSGITVNCIAPGVISTPMNSYLSQETMDLLIEETPVGKLGTPEDVARVAVFLADDKSDFLTGQLISPNGGLVV